MAFRMAFGPKESAFTLGEKTDSSLLKQFGMTRKCGWADRKGNYPLFFAARFSLAQPSFTTCFDRPSASESAGTSSVMQEAAATYEPLPSLTGATRVASLPTKT